MNALIKAIQTALKNAAGLSYITDANIFITPDENLLPVSVGFPAIGLKDGGISKEISATDGASLLWDVTYTVDVIIYIELSEGETPIIGQTTPKIYGVLDIRDDIHTALHENELSISGVMMAYCANEGASEWMGTEDLNIQRKRLTYTYEIQETM